MQQADWELERMRPPARRGEAISLDVRRERHLVGRSLRCDVRLYSATASREHAELRRDAGGQWWLAPLPGKIVLADGEVLRGECELCEGLNLDLGGDRLRCRRASRDSQGPRAVGSSSSGPSRVVLGIAVGLLALLLGVLVLWRVSE